MVRQVRVLRRVEHHRRGKGRSRGRGPARKPGGRVAFVGLAGEAAPPPRLLTGIGELDRVLGGGLVSASAMLSAAIRASANPR